MRPFNTSNAAVAVWILTLIAAPLVHARNSTAARRSTDIYNINFQKEFPTDHAISSKPNTTEGTGSTDIYATNFQEAFATDRSIHGLEDTAAYHGSTDIYRNEFQKSFM